MTTHTQPRYLSPLEQHWQTQPLSICSAFTQTGTLTPVAFEVSQDGQSDPGVDALFPKTTGQPTLSATNQPILCKGKRFGVLFSGGPAPGGHNVVAGLFHVLHPANTLVGINNGPKGLLEGQCFDITPDHISTILNTGGFDFLGSDRTKIKTPQQFEQVKQTVINQRLDGLVIVGGDDSNTNAALLAEFLHDVPCSVIGVPKTIDGDLQLGQTLPISFGFDTATRIYAEMVGNIIKDSASSRKYWHIIKLMGRSASHVTLEVALQTQPHWTLISEEIAQKKQSLTDIIRGIATCVADRFKQGKAYGVMIVPEGLVEAIDEMSQLLDRLNQSPVKELIDQNQSIEQIGNAIAHPDLKALWFMLPRRVQETMIGDKDAHGNLNVSSIPTEELISELVSDYLAEHHSEVAFKPIHHFFGYEGRCGSPSYFDAFFCYNLGIGAGSLLCDERTGYMVCMNQFDQQPAITAVPLVGLLQEEIRHGQPTYVIRKALVELDSPAFRYFESHRSEWASKDAGLSAGPRQFWGPLSKVIPTSVVMNQHYQQSQMESAQ